MVEKGLSFLFYYVCFPFVLYETKHFGKSFLILFGIQLLVFPIVLLIYDRYAKDIFYLEKLREFLKSNTPWIFRTVAFAILCIIHYLAVTNTYLLLPGMEIKTWMAVSVCYGVVPQRYWFAFDTIRKGLFFVLCMWQLIPFMVVLMMRPANGKLPLTKEFFILTVATCGTTLYWLAIASGILILPSLWK